MIKKVYCMGAFIRLPRKLFTPTTVTWIIGCCSSQIYSCSAHAPWLRPGFLSSCHYHRPQWLVLNGRMSISIRLSCHRTAPRACRPSTICKLLSSKHFVLWHRRRRCWLDVGRRRFKWTSAARSHLLSVPCAAMNPLLRRSGCWLRQLLCAN